MHRRTLRIAVSLVVLATTALTLPPPAAADLRFVEITYSVGGRGAVTPVEAFAAGVDIVFKDPRGWSLGGSIRFRRVPTGGDFRLLIVADAIVPTYGGPCTRYFSCQPGRDIVINDDRWRFGSKYWPGAVPMYRHLVINHEVGHWLGFRHVGCPGTGALAPVAMQQSKGLNGCVANPWPTPQERQRLASVRGVEVLPLPGSRTVATPSGGGHWRSAPDGGVFAYGDAGFYGSLGDRYINQPVVGIAATTSGHGYWLVASDGGIFTFGDAPYHGSAGDVPLRAPVTAMARTPSGRGYWLVAIDGGVFTYGDAPYKGSAAGMGIVATDIRATATGYDIVTRSGAVLSY